jgi:hypothetical protein
VTYVWTISGLLTLFTYMSYGIRGLVFFMASNNVFPFYACMVYLISCISYIVYRVSCIVYLISYIVDIVYIVYLTSQGAQEDRQ